MRQCAQCAFSRVANQKPASLHIVHDACIVAEQGTFAQYQQGRIIMGKGVGSLIKAPIRGITYSTDVKFAARQHHSNRCHLVLGQCAGFV